MEYGKAVDPRRITQGTRDRIEALSSTVDMIDVCIEIAQRETRGLQKHYEEQIPTKYGDWRTVYTMLALVMQQVDIVKDVIDVFEREDVRTQAA